MGPGAGADLQDRLPEGVGLVSLVPSGVSSSQQGWASADQAPDWHWLQQGHRGRREGGCGAGGEPLGLDIKTQTPTLSTTRPPAQCHLQPHWDLGWEMGQGMVAVRSKGSHFCQRGGFGCRTLDPVCRGAWAPSLATRRDEDTCRDPASQRPRSRPARHAVWTGAPFPSQVSP